MYGFPALPGAGSNLDKRPFLWFTESPGRSSLPEVARGTALLERASHHFTSALGSWAESAEAYCALGVNAAIFGLTDQAESDFKRAVDLKPEYSWARYCLGIVCFDGGKHKEAVEHLRSAHQGMPESLRIARALGKAYVAVGDADSAIATFRDAIGRRAGSCDSARLYLEMGNACHVLGRQSEARAAFERALEIDSNMVAALRNLGTLHMRAGEIDKAVAVLERAVALDQIHAKTLHKLALAYFEKGDQARAEALMRRALELEGAGKR